MPGLFTDDWVPLPEPWDTRCGRPRHGGSCRAGSRSCRRDRERTRPPPIWSGVFVEARPSCARWRSRTLPSWQPVSTAIRLRRYPTSAASFPVRRRSPPARKSSCGSFAAPKSRGALLLALADLSAALPIDAVLSALTDLADSILAATVDYLLLAAARTGKLKLASADRPGSRAPAMWCWPWASWAPAS